MNIHTAVEDDLLLELRSGHSNCETVESGIALLRSRGVSKIGSIRLLHLALCFDLNEAKSIVHASPTWSDRRVSDEAFMDSVADSLAHAKVDTAA